MINWSMALKRLKHLFQMRSRPILSWGILKPKNNYEKIESSMERLA